jgi:hypothetical protein
VNGKGRAPSACRLLTDMSRVGCRLRNWALLLIVQVALATAGNWDAPQVSASWSVVQAAKTLLRAGAPAGPSSARARKTPQFRSASLLAAAGDQTFALAPHTLIAGDVLVEGNTNVQPSFEGCAASCAALPECLAFNYCPQVGEGTALRCRTCYRALQAPGTGSERRLANTGAQICAECWTAQPSIRLATPAGWLPAGPGAVAQGACSRRL